MGLEGIVSKRRDRPYHAKQSRDCDAPGRRRIAVTREQKIALRACLNVRARVRYVPESRRDQDGRVKSELSHKATSAARVPNRRVGSVDLVVENVQHPATFAIQLDLVVSKYLRVAGCFGLIDVVGDLRQHMLAENASLYFVSSLLITVESGPAEFGAAISIDPSALGLSRLNYPDEAFIYVAEHGIAEDFH